MKLAISLALVIALVSISAAQAVRADEQQPLKVDPTVIQAEQARIAAVAKASPSVLAIFVPGGQGGGSGVVISPDGYALTNFHVARPCGTFMKCGMSDGKLYDAVIVGLDPVGDVGLIKLFGRTDFPAAELADSDSVQPGDWCFTMGNPFLLATDFYPSVAYGVVSGVHRYQYPSGTLLEYTDCLQVDAAINPGNSGGPLFDAQGRLLGINGRGSFEKRGRVNVGVGYAISINQIKNFLGDLKSGRIVDHATLGAQVSTSDDGRVLVSDILEHSDAYRRGLRYDDEIIFFAGRPVHSVNQLKNLLGIFPKGWRVALTYRRDGKNVDTFVRLMGVHTEAELLAKMDSEKELQPQQPNPRRPRNGRHPNDEPKPGQQPDDKHQPGEQPKLPPNSEELDQAVRTPVPDELKKQFEERTGYANFYFNRENTQRVWKALAAQGDFADAAGQWTISGQQIAAGPLFGVPTPPGQSIPTGPVTIHLAADQCDMDLPTSPAPSKINVADGIDAGANPTVLNPPGSGGLLAALHLWRKLLVGGPGKYGQVTYEGLSPVAGHNGLCDVLLAVGDGVESRFFVDPADGTLLCIEMYPDDDSDPCEVYFSQYRPEQGRNLPHRMEVHCGDVVFGVFALMNFDLQTATDEAPEK
jgi:serine protease Do